MLYYWCFYNAKEQMSLQLVPLSLLGGRLLAPPGSFCRYECWYFWCTLSRQGDVVTTGASVTTGADVVTTLNLPLSPLVLMLSLPELLSLRRLLMFVTGASLSPLVLIFVYRSFCCYRSRCPFNWCLCLTELMLCCWSFCRSADVVAAVVVGASVVVVATVVCRCFCRCSLLPRCRRRHCCCSCLCCSGCRCCPGLPLSLEPQSSLLS